MKRRWKILLGAGGILLASALAPIVYIETACRSPLPGLDPGEARRPPLIKDAAWQRDEARTWLTYPEWHIVYSADSYGRFLEKQPPSAFPYLRHIQGFWSGYCAVNRAAAGQPGRGDARVMLYTIGLSFSAEMFVKAAYENTVGRLFEWLGGWPTADDRYAAKVQQAYGAFMHEVPWYEFPFSHALRRVWKVEDGNRPVRHWERRLALSAEYGVKAGYAGLIGWASGAALGRDERNLQFVARGNPDAIRRIDPRLRPIGAVGNRLQLVEAPRYAQFTELLLKMSASPVEIVEISGNDDIFVTMLVRDKQPLPRDTVELMSMPLDERAGWERVGVAVKVGGLLPFVRKVHRSGGEIEHVYDY